MLTNLVNYWPKPKSQLTVPNTIEEKSIQYPETIVTSTSGLDPCKNCERSLQNLSNKPQAAFELMYKSTIAKHNEAFGAWIKKIMVVEI